MLFPTHMPPVVTDMGVWESLSAHGFRRMASAHSFVPSRTSYNFLLDRKCIAGL